MARGTDKSGTRHDPVAISQLLVRIVYATKNVFVIMRYTPGRG
jgi:hypothetical protein